MNAKRTVYVGVRTDIPLSQQIVQASHAALEAGFSFSRPDKIAHLVLLEIQSQDELRFWSDRMNIAGIKHEMFFEPDNDMGHSAFATEALCNERKKFFRRGKLWSPK